MGNYGISVNSDLTINGGTINATGGASGQDVEIENCGIKVIGDCVINGGTVTATANGNLGTGLSCDNDKDSGVSLILNGGSFKATNNCEGDNSIGVKIKIRMCNDFDFVSEGIELLDSIDVLKEKSLIKINGGTFEASGKGGATNLQYGYKSYYDVDYYRIVPTFSEQGSYMATYSIDGINSSTCLLDEYHIVEDDQKNLTVLEDIPYSNIQHLKVEPTTLYYNNSDSKMYLEQAYTNEAKAEYLDGWTASGSSLSLEDFNFTTKADNALVLPDGVTMTLTGENTVSGAINGISSADNLTINGTGSLNVKGGETGITCTTLEIDGGNVISSGGNKAISNDNIVTLNYLDGYFFKASDTTTAPTSYTSSAQTEYMPDASYKYLEFSNPIVETPKFNLVGGTYSEEQSVTISCETSGATIRYTTYGTEPNESSTAYTAPITISATTTIKVKAFKENWAASETASAAYTISTSSDTFTPSYTSVDLNSTEEKIKQTANAKDGDTVSFDLTNRIDKTVDKQIIENIKGKDVDLVISVGNGVEWVINGKDIPEKWDAKSINLTVKTGKANSKIPVTVVNELGNEELIYTELEYEGEFGFTITMKMNIGEKFSGKQANLYYYNKEGKLKLICTVTVESDGTVLFPFSHASSYIIQLTSVPIGDDIEEPDDNAEVTTDNVPKNDNPPTGVSLVALSIATLLSLTTATATRKRRK